MGPIKDWQSNVCDTSVYSLPTRFIFIKPSFAILFPLLDENTQLINTAVFANSLWISFL